MKSIRRILIIVLIIASSFNAAQAACCDNGCSCTNQYVLCSNNDEGVLLNGTVPNCGIVCPQCEHPMADHTCSTGEGGMENLYSNWPTQSCTAKQTCD